MRPELAIPFAFALAALVTFVLTPGAIRLAHATGFLDKPAGYKGHGDATPYLGGSAIMAGVLVAGLAFGGGTGSFAVLLGCAALLWVVGTADDRLNLSPFLRLALEIGIGAALFSSGHGWSIFGGDALDLALTIAWVVGVVNAVNLMDNMDGAAATVVAISAAGTGALAVLSGDPTLGALCLAVAGGCAGFLPRNLARPSRIFMGDGGSMPLGLLLAAGSMQVGSAGHLGAAAVLQAALVVGLVILDTALVTTSRRRGGRPLMTGGRDHLTHRLRTRLESPRAVAASLAFGQLLLCAATIGVAQTGVAGLLIFSGLALFGAALVIGRLEHHTWFDAPAAEVLVTVTHAEVPRRTTKFVRRRDHAPATVPAQVR